jgi:hypothetical protein
MTNYLYVFVYPCVLHVHPIDAELYLINFCLRGRTGKYARLFFICLLLMERECPYARNTGVRTLVSLAAFFYVLFHTLLGGSLSCGAYCVCRMQAGSL